MRGEIERRFAQIMDSASFILREHCQRFEEEFARYLRCGHVVGVGNGTDALSVALRAVELMDGDEVITAANSFVATAEAIVLAGGHPVLVDVDPVTYTIDSERVREAITPRTRAIVPVHMYGQAANMEAILDVATGRGISVIEDVAQAHGAWYRGSRTGTWGRLGCFSFYPTKNLGAFGDAGAVVTDDAELANRVRMLRDHGGLAADDHDIVGQNSRMDALQAAVLSVKLPHLDEWNNQRRRCAAWYTQRLGVLGADRIAPPIARGDHIFHIFVIRVLNGQRDRVLSHLRAHGIGAGVHYPGPIHRTKAFSYLGLNGKLPTAERLDEEILSLPMHSWLTEEDVDYVCSHVASALSGV